MQKANKQWEIVHMRRSVSHELQIGFEQHLEILYFAERRLEDGDRIRAGRTEAVTTEMMEEISRAREPILAACSQLLS